jgi:DnaJ-class molecular chaperone
MKDPFKILGCSVDASREEIIKKYRSLALKYHPDRNINLKENDKHEMEEKFKEISCAYKFLEKNNFKNTFSNLGDEYSKFTYSFKFFNKDFVLNSIKIGNFFKNMDFDNIANNILKEVNTIQDLYKKEDATIEKSQDITINARVNLLDIYNKVKKELSITCVKKCSKCMGRGYDINSKLKCDDCGGIKIREENQHVEFLSNIKNTQLLGKGNEEINKRPGDIFINLFPQPHNQFRIIDDYNILFEIIINSGDKESFKINNKNNHLFFEKDIEYLDLKNFKIIIKDPIPSFKHEYKIEGFGLFLPNSDTRGNLFINIFDPDKIIQKEYNRDTTLGVGIPPDISFNEIDI